MKFRKTFICFAALILFGLTAGLLREGAVNAQDIRDEERYVGASGATQGEAIPLKSSTKWRTGIIEGERSGYYYSIEVKNSSIVTLNVKNTLSGEEVISFRDIMSDAVITENIAGGSSKKYTIYIEPGKYAIYCGRYNRDDSGKVSLKCQWKDSQTPKDIVDNDTVEKAVDISDVKKSFPAMLALGDAGDFYKISFSNRELREIKIKNSVADSTRINIYDGSSGTLENINQHIMKKGEVYSYPITLEHGPIYIEVTGTQNGKYTLQPVWNITSNSIKVTGKNIIIYEGETKKVITKVTPANADEDSYYIESSNKKIVGIASNKSITGCKNGKAKITIHYGRDYNETGKVYRHKIVCNVTVKKADIKKITPNTNSVSLDKGKKYTLKVAVTPKRADKRDLVYKSSNKKIATVTQKGVITAVSPGKAVITISNINKPKVNATVTVNVEHIIKNVYISQTSLTLRPGKTEKLSASVSPSGTKYGTVKWSSSNTGVVTVDQYGNVTAVGTGNAVITVTSTENPSAKASCSVTVKKKKIKDKDKDEKIEVEEIEISQNGAVLTQGGSVTLSAVLKPSGAEGTVSWSIADSSIATISASGNSVTITGQKFGTTYLTASIGEVKKSVSITVH